MAGAFDPSLAPLLVDTSDWERTDNRKRNLLKAGLSAGTDNLQSLGGSAVELVGRLSGAQGLEKWGADVAARNDAEAQQNGRADLEIAPWKEDGASILPWLVYQTAKQVPQLAGYAAGALAMPAAAVPAGLARLGAVAPKILGGGGLTAGAGIGARRAAAAAGDAFARKVTAAGMLGTPLGAGAMYQEAKAAAPDGDVSTGTALAAAALAPVYAGLDVLELPLLSGIMKSGKGNIVKRMLGGAAVAAAAEVPQEGMQTALEQSFRTDLPMRDRMANIVEGALTGGAVGGVLGGMAGIRRAKMADPTAISTGDLSTVVNEALALPAPPVAVDSGGRAVLGSNGIDQLLATPGGEPRASDSLVTDAMTPGGPPLIESQTIIQGKSKPIPFVKKEDYEQGSAGPFAAAPQAELEAMAQTAGNYLSAREGQPLDERDQKVLEQYQMIVDELEYRDSNATLTDTPVTSGAVGAVERGSDVSGGATARNSAAPASATTTDLPTVLKGVSTRKAYAGATTLDEAKSILISRLEAGSTAKGDLLMAERLGVDLNEPAAPVATTSKSTSQPAQQTPLADQTTTTTTAPAAPANLEGGDASVDADFQTNWTQRLKRGTPDTKPLRGTAIQELLANPPANEEQAKLRIYDALAGSPDEANDAPGARDGYAGITTLAQEYGLIDDQGQLTEEGVRVARVKLPLEVSIAAAKDAGYTGIEASAFDRGARGERNVTLKSRTELQAYNDGRDWAINRDAKNAPIPNTAGEAETQQLVNDTTARADGLGRVTRQAVTSAGVPEKQQNMQFLNQAVDQVYGSTVQPQELAQLKRMVREGKTGAEIDEAARYFASGRGALVQAQPYKRPFRGEVIERGPLIRHRERLAREAAELQLKREAEAKNVGAKAKSTKLRDEYQAQKDSYRDIIDGYMENGELSVKERTFLLFKLARGDFKGIEDQLSQKQGIQVDRREFLAGVAAVAVGGIPSPVKAKPTQPTPASAALRRQLMVGNITGALKVIKDSSSRGIYRVIAAKLLRGDWSRVTLNVLGDSPEVRGMSTVEDNGDSRIDIYGEDGLNEETFLHEMIHAYVQQIWGGVSVYTPHNKRLLKDAIDRGDKTIGDFNQLWDTVARILEKKFPEIREGVGVEIWAQNVWADPDEMLSWVLTNKDAQTFLRSIDINGDPVSTEPSLWSRFMKFISDLLGMPYNDKTLTAFDRIMSAGFSVLDAGQGQKVGDFNVKLAAGIAEQRNKRDAGMPLGEVLLSELTNAQHKAVVGNAIKAAESFNPMNVVGKLRKVALGWMSLHGANELYGTWFDRRGEDGKVMANGAEAYEAALNEKNAITARFAQMMTNVRDAYEQLMSKHKDSAETIVKLMRASEFGINPTKSWKEQSEKVRESKNAANLEKLHRQFHDQYRKLIGRGHEGIYADLRNVNDTLMLSTLAVSLHQHVEADGHAKGRMDAFGENPMDAFMREMASKDFSPADARAWWATRIKGQTDATFSFLDGQRKEQAGADAKTQEVLGTHITELGKRANDIVQTVRQLDDAPYFHLGRYGDFFTGWRVRSSEALAQVAEKLSDLGFDGVISDGTDKLRVYMRVESRTAQDNLDAALRAMGEDLIEPETIRSGQRSDESYTGGFIPQWANQMLASIKEQDLPPEDIEAIENSLRASIVDLAPEMSLSRVMTHRESVPGYSPDMMRSFDWRAQVGISALAGMSIAPKITQAFVDMRGALNDAQTGDVTEFPLEQRRGMQDVVNEYSRRERERAVWRETRALDQIKGVSTAWFLGFSVSYGFVNMTQLGATLLPELGARHGFSKAFSAIAKATPLALKIMREVWRHGREVSLDRAQDAVITHDALRKVVGKETAEYIMRVVNTGNLDIGGPSRELVRSAEGRGDDGVDRVLRYASAIGYYTETTSRLIAAIATKQLNPGLPVEKAADRAAHVLNETMWNYSRTNQGRQFGKMGFVGAATPLLTQFLQFQAQLTEKLFREVYNATKGETAKSRAEARSYIKGHLTAMTVLAGSMGLPMVTVFATAIDRLKDMWDEDEEPTNVRAAYRNWLAETIGKEAGEIVAHGGFRALNFDISSRIGEQDIIPFSKFLADRRGFKESTQELALRTWGAPFSLVANWLQGGQKIAEGDMMGGITQMLPNGFAAPAKAFRMEEDGLVDGNGRKLPVDTGAWDVMVQLLGFNPSVKAEYSEARQDQAMRKGILTRRMTNLRDGIVDAIQSGDNDKARELIETAQVFDRANAPAFSVLKGVDDALKRRVKNEAVARALHTPLGVSIKDIDGHKLTQYANY